jgi:hypothetical protein
MDKHGALNALEKRAGMVQCMTNRNRGEGRFTRIQPSDENRGHTADQQG